MNLDLTTERLVLRPLIESDIEWCTEMLTSYEVMRYIYGDDVPTADEVAEEMPLAMRRCAGGCIGVWAIVLKRQHRCLGTVFLLPLPIDEDDTDWDLVVGPTLPDAEIEIGFVLRKSSWGQGFATEAAGRLVQFAFDETAIGELVAVIHPENNPSRNVLTRIGFRDEGARRAYADDCVGFRLTRLDWLDSTNDA
jgi:ribosomal-protein-alanine N-acetyltransferase